MEAFLLEGRDDVLLVSIAANTIMNRRHRPRDSRRALRRSGDT
jgi:hypothetical protein